MVQDDHQDVNKLVLPHGWCWHINDGTFFWLSLDALSVISWCLFQCLTGHWNKPSECFCSVKGWRYVFWAALGERKMKKTFQLCSNNCKHESLAHDESIVCTTERSNIQQYMWLSTADDAPNPPPPTPKFLKCANNSVTWFAPSWIAITSKWCWDPVWQTVGFLSSPITSLVSRQDHLL